MDKDTLVDIAYNAARSHLLNTSENIDEAGIPARRDPASIAVAAYFDDPRIPRVPVRWSSSSNHLYIERQKDIAAVTGIVDRLLVSPHLDEVNRLEILTDLNDGAFS